MPPVWRNYGVGGLVNVNNPNLQEAARAVVVVQKGNSFVWCHGTGAPLGVDQSCYLWKRLVADPLMRHSSLVVYYPPTKP